MPNLSIPANLQEVTPEWMTEALKTGGFIQNASVTSINTEEIGAGTGLMSAIARARLEYDNPEPDAPQTLVVKVPAEAPENLMVALTFGFYQREVNFYRYAAAESCLRAPRPYYTNIDEAGHQFVLLLEDLGQATVDQVKGAPAEISYQALMELAKYHAQFAPKVRNGEMDWGIDAAADDYVALNSGIYQSALEPALNNFTSHFTPQTRKVAEDLYDKIPPLMQNRTKEGLTMIHGDYRLDNMFMGKLPPREGFPESGLAIVDWQICCIAECGFDLAYHMCSVDIETRRKIEEPVLNDYHKTLVENGVEGYPLDYFKEQYRRYILFSLLYAISVSGNLDLANERGVELAKSLLDRTLMAIQDNKSGELMP
ncbi:MAG: phosphotransferase [Proteobacteria bacterium]|nr:phosphotransferase [Pseudomonadota bacterium]